MPRLVFCKKCDRQLERDVHFCPNCGNPIEAISPKNITSSHSKEAVDTHSAAGNGQIAWEFNIPLITNRFILYDIGKALGLSGLFLCLLLAAITMFFGHIRDLPDMFELAGICLGIFAVSMLLVMIVFFGNRIPARFVLDERGARVQNLGRRSKVGNRLAIVLGLLGGGKGLSTAGAGMLAVSQERTEIKWSDVRGIRYHPADKVISLMNSWRVVVRLYCTPENYEVVASTATARMEGRPKAKAKGRPAPGRTPLND
jgi:hypothetical protein